MSVSRTVGGGWRDVLYKGQMTSTRRHFRWNGRSHLAATLDAGTLRLFVGGVHVSSRAVFAPIATSTGALTIGGDALYGQHFAGRIDEVRTYGRALSASEIQADMTTPVGVGP